MSDDAEPTKPKPLSPIATERLLRDFSLAQGRYSAATQNAMQI